MKILFTDNHALGDACENLIAIYDYHLSHPENAVCYRGTAQELFFNLNWIDWTIDDKTADRIVPISMDLIHNSNQNGLHVVRMIEHDISKKLDNCYIRPQALKLPIQFSQEELMDVSVFANCGLDNTKPYWIVDGGGKRDFFTKHYPHSWYQQIINATRHAITWVQIGLSEHVHKPLENVVNLLDKTRNLRELLKVFYYSKGVLTPISAPLHLATMPMHNSSHVRPCVVIAGGRESPEFSKYPNHYWFSTIGQMPCCRDGGCWKSKTDKSQEKDCKSLCEYPIKIDGQCVGACMALFSPTDVAKKILQLDQMAKTRKRI